MCSPASRIVPEVGVSRPATIRSVVVLPQPDGPSSAKNDPRGTSRSRSLTAVNAPKDLVMERSRSPSYDTSDTGVAAAPEVSATCDIGPVSFVLDLLLVVQRHEVERVRERLV